MTEAQFTALVQGLRTEASHWFNNAALLELERLITFAMLGFEAKKAFEGGWKLIPKPLDNPPSGV